MMERCKSEEILLEILRVGLIAVRNLTAVEHPDRNVRQMAYDWSELCHNLPAVILGKCETKAVRYFLNAQGLAFLQSYPDMAAADFQQAARLLWELRSMVEP